MSNISGGRYKINERKHNNGAMIQELIFDDGTIPVVYLIRIVNLDGSLYEGQFSESESVYARNINADGSYYEGYWVKA